MDPPVIRRVEQAIRAWNVGVPGQKHFLRDIVPTGQPVQIEPPQEIRILWWTDVNRETMALVSCRNRLYLVNESELDRRTKQLCRTARSSRE